MSTMAHGLPELTYTATVDHALIHRRHASEAFLTDAVRTGPATFVAAALLPAWHQHYGAHTGPSRHRDPLLLLECVRQAETFAAHTMFGAERDAHFVLRHWNAEFGRFPHGYGEAELLLTATTANRRAVRDRLRGLDLDVELWSDGRRVGHVAMSVGYLSAAAFRVVRARANDGPPVSTEDLSPTAGTPVRPGAVGRRRATDVLLLDVAAARDEVTARLRVATENRSLFDHPQDHVPAMVLLEGARQLAALATAEWSGRAPEHTELVAQESTFDTYAELTAPVELVATPAGTAVDVAFRQQGRELAHATLVMGRRGDSR